MMRAIAPNATAAKLLTCLLATAFAVIPAQGQRRERVEIPYPFTVSVASHEFPAGIYTVSLNDSLLVMQSSTGAQVRQMIITRLSGPNAFLQAGSLVFDDTGGRHILSEVWLPDEDGALVYSIPKGHTRSVLSLSELALTRHASGKTAFDLTCARCHGQEGQGNPRADRYFGITIPRLRSAAVQSKSDAELSAIITAGTKNMPPVEVEEAGFRHRLPAQDVSAVIAYLRTLKQ
jgi:cytochrome c5